MTRARDISRYGLGVGIQSSGSVIAGVGITQLNFIGAGNTFRVSGKTVDVSISGGSGSSQWTTNTTGIITTSNVGIGTTNARYQLEVGSVGASGTTLFVSGDARITGILSIGTGTITLDPNSNAITVGAGITLDAAQGSITVSGSKIADATGNANYSGIVTASTFSGPLQGNASTATYATTTGIATYATSAGIATYATTSGVSTSVNGGTASVTQLNVSGVGTVNALNSTWSQVGSGITFATGIGTNLNVSGVGTVTQLVATNINITGVATFAQSNPTNLRVSGVATFTNGPVLIGSATSTETASQRLQVTGGAYVSGSVGIGTTNPTSTLTVQGDARVSGIVTATGGFNLGISSSGTTITSGPITTLNFAGAGNTFSVSGTTATITISGSGGATISTTAPTSPTNGQQWFDSSDGNTYIWYASQNVWVVSQTYGY